MISGGSYPEDGRATSIQVFSKDNKSGWSDVSKSYFPPIPMMVIDAFDKKVCKPKSLLSDSASGTFRYLLLRKGRVVRV